MCCRAHVAHLAFGEFQQILAWKRIDLILPGGSAIAAFRDIECATVPTGSPRGHVRLGDWKERRDRPLIPRAFENGSADYRFEPRQHIINLSIPVRIFPDHVLKALGHSRIARITQAVAEQVDGEHGDGQKRGGKENDVGLDLPQRPALGQDVAPGRNGGRRAGADERKDRLHDHGAGADIGRLDTASAPSVFGQDVTQDDHRRSVPEAVAASPYRAARQRQPTCDQPRDARISAIVIARMKLLDARRVSAISATASRIGGIDINRP